MLCNAICVLGNYLGAFFHYFLTFYRLNNSSINQENNQHVNKCYSQTHDEDFVFFFVIIMTHEV